MIEIALSVTGVVFGGSLFAWGYMLGRKTERIASAKEWRDYRDSFFNRVMVHK